MVQFIFEQISQVEDGAMRALRLTRLGGRCQKEIEAYVEIENI